MKILVFGNGVMANIVKDSIQNEDIFVDMIDPFDVKKIEKDFDVIIDFSHHLATNTVLNLAKEYSKPLLIATTGQTEDEMKAIENASKYIPILKMTNTSLGVKVLNKLSKLATQLLEDFDIEIVEAHHNRKVDSPSGTALTLAKNIQEVRNLKIQTNRVGKREKDELGIHSVRGGSIVGEHTAIFAGEDEIVEIKHTALSRKIFAVGAIKFARKLLSLGNGLYFDVD